MAELFLMSPTLVLFSNLKILNELLVVKFDIQRWIEKNFRQVMAISSVYFQYIGLIVNEIKFLGNISGVLNLFSVEFLIFAIQTDIAGGFKKLLIKPISYCPVALKKQMIGETIRYGGQP